MRMRNRGLDSRKQFSRWVYTPKPIETPVMRLLFFPYAGTGVEAFHLWAESLPGGVELGVVHYPGRGSRLKEPSVIWVPDLVERMARALTPFMDIPVVFFGHCMGGMLAHELARHLAATDGATPSGLIVSGVRAPECPCFYPDMHGLPDDEFLSVVKALNLRPGSHFESEAVVRSTMPILRRDFQLVESWAGLGVYPEPLRIPMRALGGSDDAFVPESHLTAWARHTAADFTLRMYPGEHFFIHDDEASQQMFRDLAGDLTLWLTC